jgi:hypothetical protein
MIRWKPVPNMRGAVFFDIPNVCRVIVRRQHKGSRLWVTKLNGKEIGLFNDRADALMLGEMEITRLGG